MATFLANINEQKRRTEKVLICSFAWVSPNNPRYFLQCFEFINSSDLLPFYVSRRLAGLHVLEGFGLLLEVS